MKKNTLSIFILSLLIFCLVGFASCKKTGEDKGSVSWNYKGTNYSAIYFYIIANENSSGNFLAGLGGSYPPRFGMTGKIFPVETGSRTITPRNMNGNWITFTDPEYRVGECTGTVNITNKASNKLSGNFNLRVDFGNGQYETIAGTISNIPITP